jgi:hypothetical protein
MVTHDSKLSFILSPSLGSVFFYCLCSLLFELLLRFKSLLLSFLGLSLQPYLLLSLPLLLFSLFLFFALCLLDLFLALMDPGLIFVVKIALTAGLHSDHEDLWVLLLQHGLRVGQVMTV